MKSSQKTAAPLSGLGDNVVPFPAPAAPRVVIRQAGYLEEADWSEDTLPSYREAWGYDDADTDAQAQMLIDISYLSESDLDAGYGLAPGPDGWSYDQHRELEDLFLDDLAQPISPEELGAAALAKYGPQRGGFAVLKALPDDECERLGLRVIDGAQPGSDYCGVCYDGDLESLNAALRRHGTNLVVRDA